MKKKVNSLKSKNAVNDLKAYVRRHLGHAIELEDAVPSTLEVQTLSKTKTITRAGELYSDSFWLQVGYGRFFKLDINSEGIIEDVTLDFCRPGKIMFLKEIFGGEPPKEFYFQLACGAVIIPLEDAYSSVLNLSELDAARLIGKVMAQDKPEYLRRMNLLQLSPRKRYRAFLKYFGADIEQYFLIKQIACFLKMRPSYLSRLRGECLRGKVEVIMYLQTVLFMI